MNTASICRYHEGTQMQYCSAYENSEKLKHTSKKKQSPKTLLDILQDEKTAKYSGGIYHKTQIDLTYNSNHIEGVRLTHEQTRYIFETWG